ncbi:MAG: hypothetical protein JWM34_4603 [Ilumatobacteraceae bacterium]|nr:hypothetical protein [Ilumatobacteraceae bacterium]
MHQRSKLARIAAAAAVAVASLVTSVLAPGSPTTAFAAMQTDLVGPPGSAQFAQNVLVLSNGNFVVTDPGFSSGSTNGVGAVYLYSGATHEVISTLTGSEAGDHVGSGSLVAVGTSNFVVWSPDFHNGGTTAVGAVTWVSGSTGLNNAVTVTNSLIGAGSVSVTTLSNHNYVVSDPAWSVGASKDIGAVTWGDGNSGVSGVVGTGTSLVGSAAGDSVGVRVLALTNGNYVVESPSWASGGIADAGAVTWEPGSSSGSRTIGPVSATNSFVGTTAGDFIGSDGVALSNGDYVIDSPGWNRAGAAHAGAVTWRDGTIQASTYRSPVQSHPLVIDNQVTTANSLVGTSASELVGLESVHPLANGNYVVSSHHFGGHLGAVTLRQGAYPAGHAGADLTAANSLTGSTQGDVIGGGAVVALSDGNFVVGSPSWHAPVGSVGAVTWVSGTTGAPGATVTAGNSLVGSTVDDLVGEILDSRHPNVVALSGGRYAVAAPSWDDGAKQDVGAVVLGAAGGATTGTIAATTALVGDQAGDAVGDLGLSVLTNGDAVVSSAHWHGSAGAATWIDVASGRTVGAISPSNSLVGSTPGSAVAGGVTVLANGNYVVDSPHWSTPSTSEVGASTWGNGASGTIGVVSATNSLVGSAADDQVGWATDALPDGSYVVGSRSASGNVAHAGAVTLADVVGSHGTLLVQRTVYGTTDLDDFQVMPAFATDGSVVIDRPRDEMVTLLRPDTTPPSFTSAHTNVAVAAAPGSTSAVVNYTNPIGVDDVGTPTVACAPSSGSTFSIGTTTVTCTATNSEPLTATTSFTVTVTQAASPTPAPTSPTGSPSTTTPTSGSEAPVTDYVAVPPARLADTRPGQTTVDGMFAGVGQLAAGSTLQLSVAGRGGVSPGAVAATLNVTVTEPMAPGFLTVYPCGTPQPTASNVNYEAGETIPNAVLTKIGANGQVCLFVQSALQLVVDVDGWYPPSTSYRSLEPARLLDTRPGSTTIDGLGAGGGAVAAGSVTVLPVAGRAGVAADASSVVLNATVTEPTAGGYATVYPCGDSPPTASNLNYTTGLTIPNLVVAEVGANGDVCIFTQAATHLVIDVDGFFPADSTYIPLPPARLLDTREGGSTIDGQQLGAGIRAAGMVTDVHVVGRGGVEANASTAVLTITVTDSTGSGYVTVYPCGTEPPLASNLNYSAGQTIPNTVITEIGAGGDVCIFNSQPTQLLADVAGSFH